MVVFIFYRKDGRIYIVEGIFVSGDSIVVAGGSFGVLGCHRVSGEIRRQWSSDVQ